jgi:hypothetical protein
MRLIHAYMANPRTVIDKTTGLKQGQLGNDPDEIWWTDRATQDRIKVFQGAPPHGESYQHLATIERWFDRVTGFNDVTVGINPTGATTGRHVALLQRAASGRVRFRLREIEDSLEQLGRLIAYRIQQFYPSITEQRVGNQHFERLELTEDDRRGTFDLEVQIIANLSEMKAQEFQKLLLLHKLGLVTDERLIEGSGHPMAQELLYDLPALRASRQLAQMQLAAQLDRQSAQTQHGNRRGRAEAQNGKPQKPDVRRAAEEVSLSQRGISRALRSGIQ